MKKLLIILGVLISISSIGQTVILKPEKPSNLIRIGFNEAKIEAMTIYTTNVKLLGMNLSNEDFQEFLKITKIADKFYVHCEKYNITDEFEKEIGVFKGRNIKYKHTNTNVRELIVYSKKEERSIQCTKSIYKTLNDYYNSYFINLKQHNQREEELNAQLNVVMKEIIMH